jgi:hypothetical protein
MKVLFFTRVKYSRLKMTKMFFMLVQIILQCDGFSPFGNGIYKNLMDAGNVL